MDVVRMKASEGRDAIVEVLQEDGAVIVEAMLSDELLGRFNDDLEPLLEGAPPESTRFINEVIAWFFGDQTRHVAGQLFAAQQRLGGNLGRSVDEGEVGLS